MLNNWKFSRIIESIAKFHASKNLLRFANVHWAFAKLANVPAMGLAATKEDICKASKHTHLSARQKTIKGTTKSLAIGSICLLTLIILFARPLFNLRNQDINQKLQSIPLEEKFFLEAFFRTLISTDNGSYVLFGDKPASLMVYEENRSHDDVSSLSDFPCHISFSPLKRGFKVWQKYQHLFPSKTHSIIKIESCFSKNMSAVFLIHNKRLLNILSKHFIDFQKKFPQFESANSLLQNMMIDSTVLRRICNKYDLLLGIILGFGKENAALFERKMRIEEFLFPQRFHSLKSNLNQLLFRPLPRPGFATLEEELKTIEMKSDGVIENVDHPGISWHLHYPLGFLVDTNKTDLRKLRTRLRRILAKANAAYNNGNFLFVTLANL